MSLLFRGQWLYWLAGEGLYVLAGAGISNHPLSGRGSPLWGRLLMSLLFRSQEIYWLAGEGAMFI